MTNVLNTKIARGIQKNPRKPHNLQGGNTKNKEQTNITEETVINKRNARGREAIPKKPK